MDPITAIGLVGNIVQVVDFTCNLISKSTELYKTGKALVGAPIIEAATVDLRLLSSKLRDDAELVGDEQIQILCESCQDVTERLLRALKSISGDSKRQIWSSVRKALKTVLKKGEIEEMDRRLAEIRHALNLRITVDLRNKVIQYTLDQSAQLEELDIMSKKILDAIIGQQDVFTVGAEMHLGMMALLQRQEQYSITADQEKQLAKLPNVPQAAFNSIERQHDSVCLEDTRIDVLETIYAWISSPDARHIFWMSGLAGTGKSTIAATVAQRHGHFTVSFFFSRGGGDNGRARKLFTSIAVQLADRSPILRSYICDAIEECSNIPSLSLHDQWRYLILTPLSRLDNSFRGLSVLLVIDALDECDDELDIKAIIQLVAEARDIKTVRFRVFLTSRPEIPIRHGFHEIHYEDHKDFVLHEIPRTTINHDINLFLVHNFKIISQERALPSEWPGDEIIKELVQKSSGLFIWAATACRFIREGKKFAKRRLSSVMKEGTSGTAPEQKLDAIYLTVLKNSISAEFDEEEQEEMYAALREILGSLVILYSPLTTKSLATLLTIPKVGVDDALEDLHAILDVPLASDLDRPIRIHHPSFRDFLLSKDRCISPDFWVDETKAHSILTHKCIEIMSASLQTDVCNLGRPGIFVSEIGADRILHHLPQEVQYACSHWLQHLEKSKIELADNDTIHTFLKKHFLHWLEALSLISKISEGVSAILHVESNISRTENPLLYAFVYDMKRFTLANRAIIEHAPLQTYSSALVFSPRASLIRQQFEQEIPSWIVQTPKTPIDWSANLQTLAGHTDWVRDLAFSPDGTMVASASADKTIRLWDADSGATLQTLEGHTEWVYSVAFSKNGTLASGSSDKTIRLWDSSSGALMQILKGHTLGIRAVAFAPDGDVLASSSADNTLRLWNVITGATIRTLCGHTEWVYNISFAKDGRLASASADRTVRIWDPSSGTCLQIIDGYSSAVRSVAFSPDGKQVTCVTSDKTVWIWEANSAEGTLHQLDGHTDWVYGVAFSPDGKMIASVSADRTVKLWNAKSREIAQTLNGHSDWIYAVAFSPDGTLLASGGADKSIRLWEVKSVVSPSLQGHVTSVHAVTLSSDGRMLASAADDDNTIRLWDAESGVNKLALDGHSDWIYSFAFSPSGSVLASTSDDKTIRIWDTSSGVALHTLCGHENSIRGISFSPDGKLLASASDDKTVKLWDYNDNPGLLIQTLLGHDQAVRAVAFSQDSTIIATSSDDKMVKLWRYNSGTVTLLVTLEGHRSTVRAVAFCPGDELLASTSADGMVRVWDIVSSKTVHTIQTSDYIGSLGFCPIGPFLQTNKGLLKCNYWDFKASKTTASPPPNLRLNGHWITRDGENLLWLPPHYRPTSSSFAGDIFGIGHSSGLVSFMKLT